MKPSLYIGIRGPQRTKYCSDFYNRQDLSLKYPYVLEGYEESNNKFSYKIFKDDEEQHFINVGNWKIVNIRPCDDMRIAFLFDLIDPNGKSSEDNDLPYHQIFEGEETFLYAKFIYNDNTGLNHLMNIVDNAAHFGSWTDFIKNESNVMVRKV